MLDLSDPLAASSRKLVLSQRLQGARLAAGYFKISEVIDALGVKAPTYRAAEAIARKATPELLASAADHYGVSVGYLLGETPLTEAEIKAANIDEMLRTISNPRIGKREFARWIRKARTRHFETASDAARELKWPEVTYRAHESGLRPIPVARLAVYAIAFQADPSDLLPRTATSQTAGPALGKSYSGRYPNRDDAESIEELQSADDKKADWQPPAFWNKVHALCERTSSTFRVPLLVQEGESLAIGAEPVVLPTFILSDLDWFANEGAFCVPDGLPKFRKGPRRIFLVRRWGGEDVDNVVTFDGRRVSFSRPRSHFIEGDPLDSRPSPRDPLVLGTLVLTLSIDAG